MTPVFLDFETFWSQDHSLSKMNPIAYVMHPETEIISCAIKVGKAVTQVYFGLQAITKALDAIDWDDAMAIGHNMSGFDCMLLAWRLGIRPKMWGCTLSMARPLHAKTCGVSLAKLVEHYGLGVKDNTALTTTKGKHLKDFTPAEIEAMRAYNAADTEQCAALFYKLAAQLPRRELVLIDSTIRMLVNEQFECDVPLLEHTLVKVQLEKRESLLRLADFLGVVGADPEEQVREQLSSSAKLVRIFEEHGGYLPQQMFESAEAWSAYMIGRGGEGSFEIPTKISKTTKKWTYAFSKQDEAFMELTEHDNGIVAAAAATRLEVKSTQLETRMQTFIEVGKLRGGKLPVAANYAGADTTWRPGGTFKMNQLNLPRVGFNKDGTIVPKNSNALRACHRAPKGKVVVTADSSGIEMRVNHTLWKVPSSMEMYQADPEADLYRKYASEQWRIPMDEVTKDQRQGGKVAQLQLGFQSGWKTLQSAAKRPPYFLILDDQQAKDITYGWRDFYSQIVGGWANCELALHAIHDGDIGFEVDPWGMIKVIDGGLSTPQGRFILYPGLHQEMIQDPETGRTKLQWVYGSGRSRAFIYGGKMTENCVTADTEVLTPYGWKPIICLQKSEIVWDGTQWCAHAGVVAQGRREVIDFGGVGITADHEVLVDEQWIQAGTTTFEKAASSFARSYGLPRRDADSCAVWRKQRTEITVGGAVRLWCRKADGVREPGEAGALRQQILRLRALGANSDSESNARHVKASSVCGAHQHDRALLAAATPGVAQLWRSWHQSLRSVGRVIRELLGGYGADVPAWAGVGSDRQQRGLHTQQLSLGDSKSKHPQQTRTADFGHAARPDAAVAGTRDFGAWRDDAAIPACRRLAREQNVRPAGSKKIEEVFDILDCGPRRSFVVRGSDGRPFIIHNCVQHLANTIMTDYQIEYERTKLGRRFPLANFVYDEFDAVVDEAAAEDVLGQMQEIMRRAPAWWPEIVMWSEGSIGANYAEAK